MNHDFRRSEVVTSGQKIAFIEPVEKEFSPLCSMTRTPRRRKKHTKYELIDCLWYGDNEKMKCRKQV